MHRRVARAAVTVLVVGGFGVVIGGVAAAFWQGSGGGSGSVATATTEAVTLGPGSPDAALFPGGQSAVVTVASNPNTAPISIPSLALDTSRGTDGFAVDADHAGCDPSVLSFTTRTNAGSGWMVPAKTAAGDGRLAITMSDALSMDVGAANACQGGRFKVYLVTGS